MKKRYLLLFAVFLLAFGALFTLLSAAPPGSTGRSYLQISVITRESDSSVWASIRQGMEQAANDLDVELRLVTLSEANSLEEQKQLLAREAQGGADALILSPIDPEALAESADNADVPVIMIGALVDSYPSITPDNEAMGRSIALAMLPRLAPGGRVVLLSVAPGRGAVGDRAKGAAEALRGAGIIAEELLLSGVRTTMSEALGELMRQPPELIIALEPVALEAAARAAQGIKNAPDLCGIGSTGPIVSWLERGAIEAIAAQNDFAAGYLAISAAVNTVAGRPVAGDPIGFSIIRRDTMYLPENQKLLFPFVR